MKQRHPINVLSESDSQLFRSTVGRVTPLAHNNRVIHEPTRPQFRGLQSPFKAAQGNVNALSDHITGDIAEHYLSNGLSLKTLRKLRRSEWPIADRLDLHGLNTENARQLLQQFLLHAQQQQARCVLIIHGKGLNSHQNKAVLRELTRHWLVQHPLVLAYCSAPIHLGGDGALLALLKNISDIDQS